MEVYQKESIFPRASVQRLEEFIQERSEKRAREKDVSREESFESYEQEVHKLVMAVERELVGEELSRYDMNAKEIEVAGKVYRRGVRVSPHQRVGEISRDFGGLPSLLDGMKGAGGILQESSS